MAKFALIEDTSHVLHVKLKPVGDGSVTDLVLKWFKFDPEKAVFKLVSKQSASEVQNYEETALYACSRSLLDLELGVLRPYFCITSKKKRGDSIKSVVTLYTTSNADENSEDYQILRLRSGACDSSSIDFFRFMNGPMLCWRSESHFYFFLRNFGKRGEFSLSQARREKMVKEFVTDPQSVEVLSVCSSKRNSTSCLLLFVSRKESKFLLFEVDCSISNSKVVLLGDFIPNRYADNVRTVTVYTEDERICSILVSRDDEAMFFTQAEMRLKVRLEPNPSLHLMDDHVVVKYDKRIEIRDREKFDVVMQYNENLFLIGDFKSRGSDQLLILSEVSSNQEAFSKFVLTDFFTVYYDTRKGPTTLTTAVYSTMMKFSNAMENRVNTSVQWLVQTQTELTEKMNHVRDSCNNISRTAANIPPENASSNLVPFINTTSDSSDGTECSSVVGNKALTVGNIWQMIVLNKLCIGVSARFFENVDSLSLGLIPKDEFLNSCCVSKMVKCLNGDCVVICITDPPLMVKSRLECDLIFNYVCNEQPRSAVCGKLAIEQSEIRRMMDDEMSVNMKDENVLLSLDVIQLKVRLSIESYQIIDEDFFHQHLQSLNFRINLDSTPGRQDYHWFFHEPFGALAAVRIKLLSWERGKITLEVRYRDRAQILCLVHTLYELLGHETTSILCYHGSEDPVAMETDIDHDDELMNRSDIIFDEV